MSNLPYSITPARYAKGKLIIRTTSNGGYKSRACRLAGDGLNLPYSHRSGGYTASQGQADRFERLFQAGFDACFFSGAIDHDGERLRDLTWREADRLALQWVGRDRTPIAA